MDKINLQLSIKIFIILLIFAIATFMRLNMFSQSGKDIDAYKRAATDFLEGRNPYEWTLESFSNPDDPGNHGFAYLPTLIYINSIALVTALLTNIPFVHLQKIPILLADLGIGILFVKMFFKSRYAVLVVALLTWFWHPYFFLKQNYVYMDPLPIFFMFLALFYLDKDDVVSGALYALAISIKTFPIILLPIFFLKSRGKMRFLVAAGIVGIATCIPFIGDLQTFIKGAILIHGERFVQGRPFLFYISYFYKIELFQIIPFKVYTYLATFGGPLLTTVAILKCNSMVLQNKYILSTLSFFLFYLFTPVLNRTYLMWFMPILIVAAYQFANLMFDNRKKSLEVFTFSVINGFFWIFYYIYLLDWKDGFHIWRP